jgi:hypothetical protein
MGRADPKRASIPFSKISGDIKPKKFRFRRILWWPIEA